MHIQGRSDQVAVCAVSIVRRKTGTILHTVITVIRLFPRAGYPSAVDPLRRFGSGITWAFLRPVIVFARERARNIKLGGALHISLSRRRPPVASMLRALVVSFRFSRGRWNAVFIRRRVLVLLFTN